MVIKKRNGDNNETLCVSVTLFYRGTGRTVWILNLLNSVRIVRQAEMQHVGQNVDVLMRCQIGYQTTLRDGTFYLSGGRDYSTGGYGGLEQVPPWCNWGQDAGECRVRTCLHLQDHTPQAPKPPTCAPPAFVKAGSTVGPL